MSVRRSRVRRALIALALFVGVGVLGSSCYLPPIISFTGRPAHDYDFGSRAPLRIAVIDDTGGTDWSPAVDAAVGAYGSASPYLAFQASADGANIVIHVGRYSDAQPPDVRGYDFTPGVGGFAAVYDSDGYACNFPALAVDCSGEIAEAHIYLNDVIPAGRDIEVRRERLILHELGHALGLERHSPDFDIAQLAERYGWR